MPGHRTLQFPYCYPKNLSVRRALPTIILPVPPSPSFLSVHSQMEVRFLLYLPSISQPLHLVFLLPRMLLPRRATQLASSLLPGLYSKVSNQWGLPRPLYRKFQPPNPDTPLLLFLFSFPACISYFLFFLNDRKGLVWFVHCQIPSIFTPVCLAYSRRMINPKPKFVEVARTFLKKSEVTYPCQITLLKISPYTP